jgi:hypothetical protein
MTVISLQQFDRELRIRLEKLTPGEVRAAVLRHAAALPGRDRIAFLLDSASRTSWRNPRQVVLPYLLAAGSGAVHRPEWSGTELARLFAELGNDNAGWSEGPTIRIIHTDESDWDINGKAGNGADKAAADQLPLGAILGDLIARRTTQPQQRSRWLAAARAAMDHYLQAIVGGQQRAYYGRAARLAVACGEALSIADPEDSADYTAAVRARYPRHVAFRRELDTARAASSVVPRC